MQFDLNTHTTSLELRIMDLEDTTQSVVKILKTMNEMVGHLNEISKSYGTALTALLGCVSGMASPRTAPPYQVSHDGSGSADEFPGGAQDIDHPDTP